MTAWGIAEPLAGSRLASCDSSRRRRMQLCEDLSASLPPTATSLLPKVIITDTDQVFYSGL